MAKTKILLIESEKEIRKSIINFLSKTGDYRFFEASDGEDGITMFNFHRPNIVIIDLRVSGVRGEEVIRIIKRPLHNETNMICFSSNSELEEVAKAAGCDVFLKKPFHLLQLQEAVEKLLKKNCIKTLTCR